MKTHTCEECKCQFERNACENRPARFCSNHCYVEWNKREGNSATRFKSGQSPWNAGTKGVMRPNTGSFRKGMVSRTKLPIGATTIRTARREGKPRRWIKVADSGRPCDWKLMAVFVWEQQYGALPRGMVIHHEDRDQLNDSLGNLKALTKAEHIREHRNDYEHKRRSRASDAARSRHAANRAKKAAQSKPHAKNTARR